jgi:hypothetical protein
MVGVGGFTLPYICYNFHTVVHAGDWLTLVPPVQLTSLLLQHHQLLLEQHTLGRLINFLVPARSLPLILKLDFSRV